jgi:hypothetical protein
MALSRLFLDQSLDGRRQFKKGIGQRLVAHGFVSESLTLVACAGGISGSDQWAAKIPVILKNGERKRLRRVIGLEAIAYKQAGLDIIELVVVFPTLGRARLVEDALDFLPAFRFHLLCHSFQKEAGNENLILLVETLDQHEVSFQAVGSGENQRVAVSG